MILIPKSMSLESKKPNLSHYKASTKTLNSNKKANLKPEQSCLKSNTYFFIFYPFIFSILFRYIRFSLFSYSNSFLYLIHFIPFFQSTRALGKSISSSLVRFSIFAFFCDLWKKNSQKSPNQLEMIQTYVETRFLTFWWL